MKPTLALLAAHIREAVDWTKANRDPLGLDFQTHPLFAQGQEIDPCGLAFLPEGKIHSRLIPNQQHFATLARARAQDRHALALERPEIVLLLARRPIRQHQRKEALAFQMERKKWPVGQRVSPIIGSCVACSR